MEEILREIKAKEQEAADMRAAAQKKAAELSLAATNDVSAMRLSYEQKLKDDAIKIITEAKTQGSLNNDAAIAAADANAKRIAADTRKKVADCAAKIVKRIYKETI